MDYSFRKKAMKEAGIYPDFLIINLDLNLISTFYRASTVGSNMTTKLLLAAIFDHYSHDLQYQSLIMFDLEKLR